MRGFRPVVLILTGAMDNGRKDLSMRCPITPQFVGDQLPGWLSLMLQHLTKEARSSSTISALGNQNIDHVSILIDGAPQIEVLTSDSDKEFIDVPNVTEPSLLPSQISSIGRTELQTPIPNSLVGDKDSSLREQVFYVSKAQGEPMVEPDSVTDYFRRKAVASIKSFHPPIVADSGLT